MLSRRSAMAKLALGVAGTYALRFTRTAAAGSASGALAGTITYSGKAPARKAMKVKQDFAVCGKKPIYDEGLVVGKGGVLANAVVVIEGIGDGVGRRRDVLLDQRDCVFKPHVLAAARGAKLIVRNSDPILNTPHAYMGRRTLFNVAQPFEGMKYTYKLKKAGLIKMVCDVHSWELAYVWVFDHPFFAVTGADGRFEIEDVPAGTYGVRVWHETLGEKTAEIAVESGTTQLALAY